MWHFIKHFMTITRHRHKVMYHCLRCGILWQGMRHDLSKYSPTEFYLEQDFISATEVRQRAKDVNTVIQRLGCTTREETNITLNIGQTTIQNKTYGGGRNAVKIR